VIGVCDAPFKCPPAPSECALLLHDHLVARGIRAACDLKIVIPFGSPVPPSPDTSRALVEAFAERDIEFIPSRRVSSIDPAGKVAVLDDESQVPFDLFLGVPKHRAPDVVITSGMTEDAYVPVDSRTLATRFPGVYAVGDVATVGFRRRASSQNARRRSSPGRLSPRHEGRRSRRATTAAAPATSSSAPAVSGASMWTSSRDRSRPEASRSPRARSSPRKPTSARAASLAGWTADQ
jgi:pyridine nucleotide-disulfide oxidoreductase